MIPIRQAIREYVDHWMMLECSEKLFPCDPDQTWHIAQEIQVDPYDVKRLFEHLQEGSYLSKSLSLQFFHTQNEQTRKEETLFMIRHEDQTIDRIPLSLITMETLSWKQDGVYQFVERLHHVSNQYATNQPSSNFETVDLTLDDEVEEDLLELASTLEISVNEMDELDELLDNLLEEDTRSTTASKLPSDTTQTNLTESKQKSMEHESSIHNHPQEDTNMESNKSAELFATDTKTKILEKIERTLHLVDQGFETSAQLYVKNGTTGKDLMKQLLYMEQELRDIQKLLDGASE